MTELKEVQESKSTNTQTQTQTHQETETQKQKLKQKHKLFGEKFMVDSYHYDHIKKKVVRTWRPLSDQANRALDYLEPYIRRGIFPSNKENGNNAMLGLYSFIADREEFDGMDTCSPFFRGFLSLKEYPLLALHETYYNKEDNIKLYVYLNQFHMDLYADKYKVKPKKAYSFFSSDQPNEIHKNWVDPYFIAKKVKDTSNIS
jgi:hypothetical protein